MTQNDRSFASLSESDLETLRRARHALESPSLAIKLSGLLGAPAETIMARLPRFAHRAITSATRLALRQCLRIALRTLRKPGPSDLAAAVPQPRNFAHKIAVAASGATGGALGLLALPVELPLTTTLIFRSICEIARSEGEDLDNLDTQLQCLAVLGLGDVRAAAPGDATDERAADLGYFALRSALAQAVSRASSEVAAKGLAAHTSTALVNLIQNVAARFSTQVTEQAAAKSLPVIGAALGAGANTLFIDHFQQVAHANFAIRRLERKYGEAAVQAAWHALDGAKR